MPEDPYKNLKINVGAVVKPRTSLSNKTGSWRSEKPVIDHQECISCGICEKFCPDMSVKDVGEGRFEIDLEYCKGCGICAIECPANAIEMVKEEK